MDFHMDIDQSKTFYVSKLQAMAGKRHSIPDTEVKRYSQLITANPLPLEFYDDLVELMLNHSDQSVQAKVWAHKIAIACCGKTHLYTDMGFEERQKVSSLFHTYFPTLAEKNIGNAMRWKKFLYRQFCLSSGLPICPSASCSECPSYSECYSA